MSQTLNESISTAKILNGDITRWLQWLFEQLLAAINESLEEKQKAVDDAFFFKRTENLNINLRQKKILSFLLARNNTETVITNRDCVQLCQTSRESIKRDLGELVRLNLLVRNKPNGRSVEYKIFRAGDIS